MDGENDQIICKYCSAATRMVCAECAVAELEYFKEAGGKVENDLRYQMCEFSFTLGNAAGSVVRVLGDDELLAQFAARGATKKQLQELLEAIKNVSTVFYNTPQPV